MAQTHAERCQQIIETTSEVVVGQKPAIMRALACVLARGHLLIEDLPGLGKTTMAHTLAAVLGLRFKRLQFTADMLPADVLGSTIYNPGEQKFRFIPGPIFTQVLLADEINRAPPKVQSALLEAMEEGQVSIEGKTYNLPEGFFVIATQNPLEQAGTYPLPESQLDRFAMVTQLGYPSAEMERKMLRSGGGRARFDSIEPVLQVGELTQLRESTAAIHVAEPVIDYTQRLLATSREQGEFTVGLSPRAGLMLVELAKSWALIHGRDHVLPDDIQAVFPDLVNHRIQFKGESGETPADLLLHRVATP